MNAVSTLGVAVTTHWRHYYELTKPRVVILMLFTALVGMVLALGDEVPWTRMALGLVGIGLLAGAGAAVNHVVDRHIDVLMQRTRHRPLPAGHVETANALLFALLLAAAGLLVLVAGVNRLTAVLTFGAMVGYAIGYTLFLKRTTPQNVVWGGAAGAAPPVLGAAAVTGEITVDALVLFLIIFIWTPPHFWPLAIARRDEYARAAIPMLPVTHGLAFTKQQVFFYSLMLLSVSLFPFLTGGSGLLYLIGALLLGLGFVFHAWRLLRASGKAHAMATFRYSIGYLFALFALLIADRYLLSPL